MVKGIPVGYMYFWICNKYRLEDEHTLFYRQMVKMDAN